MAAITFTPASVLRVTGPQREMVAGEALFEGAAYYIKASDRRAYLAQADGSAAEIDADGIALAATTAAGQPFMGQEGGDLDVGAVLVVGETYCVSRTAGKVIAKSELLTGDRVAVVGVAKTSSRLRLCFRNAEAAIPA